MATTARFSNNSQNLSELRARALQTVFPGLQSPLTGPTGVPASGPVTPTNTREFAMRAPTPEHLSAAARAAQAVATQLAAHPKAPTQPYIAPTRANTPLTQSAGTINTAYVNSARAQGYNNVQPPNIYASRGVAGSAGPSVAFGPGMAGLLGNSSVRSVPGQEPLTHNRQFYQNQVFIPTAQQRANQPLFPVPPVPAITPQIGVSAPVFPPRNQFLNYLFPR